MDWSSDLRELRSELNDFRREQQRRASVEEAERQERWAQMKSLVQSLQIEGALSEMNRLLLDGKGEVEMYAPWEIEEDAGEEELVEEDEIEEESDSASAILVWEEEETKEIAVDIGMAEGGLYLQVNGTGIRLEQEAVRKALIRAFREEIGL